LERSGFGSGGGNNDGVLESVVLLKGLDELSDGGSLLSDGDVNTVELGGLVVTVVPPLLVEDGVDGNSGLSGLTITNDQLTLSTTNGNHGVDRLETGQHGLGDRGTGENSRSLDLGTSTFLGVDRTLSIDGVTESVDYTTEHLRSDRDVDNVSGTLDCVTFLDETIVTEDGYSDIVGFQVKAHAANSRGELNHLFGLNVSETVDTSDTISNGKNATSLLNISSSSRARDAGFED